MEKESEILYDVIHNVPGAVCFYRWNGTKLLPLVISGQYSEMLGTDAVTALGQTKGLNFLHAHPEDLSALQAAVKEGLDNTHFVNHTYRSYNEKMNRYIWINIQGRSVPQPDGTQYVYVTYTNITREKEAELQLLESKKSLEVAAEQAGIWFWTYDWQHDTGYMSSRMQADFALPERMDNFLESWLNTGVIDAAYQETYRCLIGQIAAGETKVTMECPGCMPDGTEHWGQHVLHNIYDEKGQPVRAVGTVRLIDDIKELEKKYENEKQRGQKDTQLISSAVFNLSRRKTLETESCFPLHSMEQLQTLEAFRKEISGSIVEEEQRTEFNRIFSPELLLEAFRNGQNEFTLEYQRRLDGGKVIWVNSSFRMVMEPQGKDVLLFYYCSDINLSKAMEIMVAYMANADYDMLGYVNFYDGSAVMMYGENSSFGYRGEMLREENYETALEEFVDHAVVPEEREYYRSSAFLRKVRKALEQDKHYEFMVHVMGQDGRRLTKKIRYIRYKAGRDICLFTQTDITELVAEEERKQELLRTALQEAKTASRSKTSFLSQMSHEIRTPMNAIIGLSKLAQESDMCPEVRDYVEKIEHSGHYLLDIINDILDMSRIESGRFELHPEWTPANKMLMTCLNILGPEMARKGIHFNGPEKDYDQEFEFNVDPLRMKQILMNLLNNAIKFTPSGGEISITIEAKVLDDAHREDLVTISDTGCGMSDDFLKRIFSPFEQEQNPYSADVQGTGLGLALVKQILTAMGGDISVTSELGRGSTFCYRIPYEYRRIQNAAQKNEEPQSWSLSGRRILLADDRPLNREIARKLLKHRGIFVDEVSDGRQAADMFCQSPENYYDLILMDIRMPVMDGLEAVRMIRQMPRKDAVQVPVIAMTANAYEEDRQKSREAGMNAHLSKPVEPQLLYETIGRYMKPREEDGGYK